MNDDDRPKILMSQKRICVKKRLRMFHFIHLNRKARALQDDIVWCV